MILKYKWCERKGNRICDLNAVVFLILKDFTYSVKKMLKCMTPECIFTVISTMKSSSYYNMLNKWPQYNFFPVNTDAEMYTYLINKRKVHP